MFYTANQTQFFPPVYMFDRFMQSDALVLMSEAQFTKRGSHSRAKLIFKTGEYLSVVPLVNRSYKSLNKVRVCDPKKWAKKLKKQLRFAYCKCPGYIELSDSLNTMLDIVSSLPDVTIAQVGRASLEWCLSVLRINLQLFDSFDLIGERPAEANAWLLEIGKAVGCDTYIGGLTTLEKYINIEMFEVAKISYLAQDYSYCGLPDITGEINTNGLISILDPLLVNGSDAVIATGLGGK